MTVLVQQDNPKIKYKKIWSLSNETDAMFCTYGNIEKSVQFRPKMVETWFSVRVYSVHNTVVSACILIKQIWPFEKNFW